MKIITFLKNPLCLFYKMGELGLLNWMDDETYLKIKFRINMKQKLNLDNPQTFNEKLQWLKIYNRKPEYTTMVDKYEAKKYVAERIGDEYIIPTLGVWDSFDDIDFDALPDQFVLKCTHDSGGLIICPDKSKLDINAASKKINRCLKRNYYYANREWPYKNVNGRIIAEPLLDLENENSAEYKLFCFDGKLKIILLCKGKAHHNGTGERTNDFLDENYNRIPVISLNPNSKGELLCPPQMKEIKMLAEKLSTGIPQIRVDFYLSNEKVYFGELTFFHNSGCHKFEPEKYDRIFGEYINLPSSTLQ